MTSELEAARDDLAYMRALVDGGGGRMQALIGEAFMWAGVLYGAQCFLHWLQILGLVPSQGLIALAILALPTLMVCAVLGWIFWKQRKSATGGVGARALGAAFQGAGIANLAMAFVFAYGAYKWESPGLWLYHPIVVCMFQGVAWFVAFHILRRAWLGLVAAGWFATTITLGSVIGDGAAFLLVLAVSLTLLMAIPGYVMWRGSNAQSAARKG
jgi:hypothetical protein